MKNKLFDKVLIIGVGLIGSSIARALRDYELTDQIVGYDNDTPSIKIILAFFYGGYAIHI